MSAEGGAMSRLRAIVSVVLIATLLPALATVAPVASADPPFTANVRVNPDAGPTWGGSPGIAVDATGTVFAVWQGNATGDYDIYFAKSGDRGTTWTEPGVRVNADTGAAWQGVPVLAWGPSGTLYAVWQDDRNPGDLDLYFARSTDGGATWTDPNVRVNTDATTATQHMQTLVVAADDNVYVAWSDERNGDSDIYFARSADGGATWTDPNVRVNTDIGTAGQGSPFLGLDTSGALALAWSDDRDGDWAIYMARSTDGGATWTDPNTRIGADAGASWQARPALAAGPASALHAVWQDNRTGDYDVYFASSADGGATWTTPSVRVNTDAGTANQESPELAVDPATGTIYVVWHDERSGDRDVYFASSTDGGAGWLDPNVRVNDDVGTTIQWLPLIVWDSWAGGVYVTWTDYRAGNANAFLAYLQGPNRSPVITNEADAPTNATVGVPVSFTFSASDPDGDALTWSNAAGPSWLRIGPANGTIYGAPTAADLGSNSFRVEVSDGQGGSDTVTFTIAVGAAPEGPSAIPVWVWGAVAAGLLAIALILLLRRRRRAVPAAHTPREGEPGRGP